MKDINRLIDFVRFTHDIRRVKRAMLFEDGHRENDIEHQYQLALVSWFMADNDDIKLDKYKVVLLAMVHDIVEAYAGDVIAFADKQTLANKDDQEAAAIKKLKKDWPSFKSLLEYIAEYEARETNEAKFVYAMDKLLPVINNYLFNGRTWLEHGVTFEKMKSVKAGKIDANEDINEYYIKLLKILEKHPEMFGESPK